jgi:hypothetical protein
MALRIVAFPWLVEQIPRGTVGLVSGLASEYAECVE